MRSPRRTTRAAVQGSRSALAGLIVAAAGCGCSENGSQGPVPWFGTLPEATHRQSAAPGASGNAWGVPAGVKARSWRFIVIHHSGTDEGSAAAFDRYHRQVKGWKDLAYHFVIGNGQGSEDGLVEVSARWKEQRAGAHAGVARYNERGVGICLVGNFDRSVPTRKQMESLSALLAFLMRRFRIEPGQVIRHSDIENTRCPGSRFPWPVAR